MCNHTFLPRATYFPPAHYLDNFSFLSSPLNNRVFVGNDEVTRYSLKYRNVFTLTNLERNNIANRVILNFFIFLQRKQVYQQFSNEFLQPLSQLIRGPGVWNEQPSWPQQHVLGARSKQKNCNITRRAQYVRYITLQVHFDGKYPLWLNDQF